MNLFISKLRGIGAVLAFACIGAALSGCALPEKLVGQPLWKMVDSTQLAEGLKPEAGRGGVVVFRLIREGEATAGVPLDIFYNKQYMASLVSEAWTGHLSICPGRGVLQVMAGSGATLNELGDRDGEAVVLAAGEMRYFQVTFDADKRAMLRPVDAAQARAMAALPKQSHAISRVRVDSQCVASDAKAVPEKPARVQQIANSALFEFDRYEEAGLLSEGRKILKQLAAEIGSGFERVDRIVVKGYTDPMGGGDYNLVLSEKRAQTVAAVLAKSGADSRKIMYQGQGASALKVTHCSSQHRGDNAALIRCNQPNRRVEIEIFGVRRE